MATAPRDLRQQRTFIRPVSGWGATDVRELWRHRDLLWTLSRRNIAIRYKQTVLGASWAVIQPLAMMLVFNLVAMLGDLPSDGLPRPVFLYASLLPWQFFAQGLTGAANSVASNQNLVTKVYFPRLILPLSAVLPGMADFGVAFLVLAGMMAWYGIAPGVEALALPFVTQLLLFLTPVVYSASAVPERWRTVYGLNPMAGVVEGFRWALLGAGQPSVPMLAASTGVAMALLVSGAVYFRRAEQSFADVV